MDTAVRWAVLGPGSIARRFVSQLPASRGGRLVAVGSSDPARAQALASEVGPDVRTGTYAEVLADPDVDAVYIATVHTTHAQLALAAVRAGKHALVEKPLAPNAGSVMAVVDAARAAGVTVVEAFMYRFHPQTRKLLELLAAGAIGEVQHVDASFSFSTGSHRSGRLFDPALAGGGILDVGGYPVSLARAVAGAATGRRFAELTGLTAVGTIGDTGVDEWASAQLTFPGGVTASVRCGVQLAEAETVTVHGSGGTISLADPWTIREDTALTLTVVGRDPEVFDFVPDASNRPYALEADALADAVAAGGEAEGNSLEDSLGTAVVLDRWRAALGLRYPFEAETADVPTVSGLPLAVAPDAPMTYGSIPGLGKRVSRLVMGCDNQPDLAHASAIFDHFFAAGGNTFDTAWLYGSGTYEKRFGQWVANRGVREDLVVIVKGCHTPHCDPESLSRQLLESLERQQHSYADIYMMHRDNPDVPVGEFVDVLNSHVDAGRITVFGGSNWSPERVDEADEYARTHGKRGFSVLSNHFGLAEAYDVPWTGCRHVTDPESKEWLRRRQIPLLPWSSQARGFFARADEGDRSDAELVRCYYSDANFERKRRAEQLGAELGVPATAVALAFVLAQPFPTFPLFGPRTVAEARSSMTGLTVTLDERQVAWLDLRD